MCIVFASRGGSRRHPGSQRNTDYIPALELIFCRMARLNVKITDAFVASGKTVREFSKEDRRLHLLGSPFPIPLAHQPQAKDLAKRFRQAAAGIGRSPNAQGAGNPTKRIEIHFALAEPSDRSFQSVVNHLFGPVAAT
jgi:hypothetical protein